MPRPIVSTVPTGGRRDARHAELRRAALAAHGALAGKLAPRVLPSDPVEAALVAAIEDEIDHLDAYRVYGDLLQARQDPRGELIALQAAGRDEDAAAHLERHRAPLLGSLAGRGRADAGAAVTLAWRWGFVYGARVARANDLAVHRVIRMLLDEPAARFLQRLTVGAVAPGTMVYDEVVHEIGRAARPALRFLYLGDFAPRESMISASYLWRAEAMYGALANLEELILRCGNLQLGWLVLPRLRRLEIVTGGLNREALRSIKRAQLPSLERLSLHLGTARYGCDLARADLEGLLRSDRFPRLRHLGLRNTELADELCQSLHSSPLVAQLEELDLSRGTLSDDGARAIATHAAGLRQLRKLDVSESYLSARGISMLREALPEIELVATAQRLHPRYPVPERYVVVGE
ncbi:MAG: WGR domain-containing protein [Kofleriaceae bacterium]